jgi:hypothetical protein
VCPGVARNGNGSGCVLMSRKVVLADLLVDVNEKDQYLISGGDLFSVSEDQAHPGKSWLGYIGPVPKKLMKKIKAL